MPHGPVMYITIYSRRAALAGSAPTHKADGRVFCVLQNCGNRHSFHRLYARYRRGRPVSLFGPSGADQQEAQDGCQNGQLWLGVPLWESRKILFGENAIRRPQLATTVLQTAP